MSVDYREQSMRLLASNVDLLDFARKGRRLYRLGQAQQSFPGCVEYLDREAEASDLAEIGAAYDEALEEYEAAWEKLGMPEPQPWDLAAHVARSLSDCATKSEAKSSGGGGHG